MPVRLASSPCLRALPRQPGGAGGHGLRAGLDRPLPDALPVGRGTALVLTGWCFHPRRCIRRLELLADDRSYPVDLFGYPRPAAPDGEPAAPLRCGFAALLPIPPCTHPRVMTVTVRAICGAGATSVARLGQLLLRPGRSDELPDRISPDRPGTPAAVAICMATYNPPPELFERQVRSIREQTSTDWVCFVCDDHSRPDLFARALAILGDDPRFRVYRQPANRGYYRNFEQCLALVPPEVELVALADQDDVWHPEKLTTLRRRFADSTTLVSSDMRIVDAEGRVLSPTYWTTRRNNTTDLAALFMANTITGAAAMFRRRLLDTVLPFPEPFGAAFHDHWIACAALASGEVRSVDRPLYDYVQHGRNVIGHIAPPALPVWTHLWRWLKFCWPPKLAGNIRRAAENGRRYYFDHFLRVQQLAHTVALRCDRSLSPAGRSAVRCVRSLPESAAGWLWLLLRPWRTPSGVSDTAGMEYHLLNALLWKLGVRARSRLDPGLHQRSVVNDGGRTDAMRAA